MNQHTDTHAQRARRLSSEVQRLRDWAGGDPARLGDVADALNELTAHRLAAHAWAEAAPTAQEAVITVMIVSDPDLSTAVGLAQARIINTSVGCLIGFASLALFGYFFGTVLHVKSLIRERGNTRMAAASTAWHLAWTVATFPAWGATTSWAWTILFAVATLRTTALTRRTRDHPVGRASARLSQGGVPPHSS